MRKSIITMGLIVALSMASTITAFAAWEQTGTAWKYQINGTYYNDGWHWIDGNHDNIAECYYFGIDGTMLSNTITPDNYTVNSEGAWIVNGIVQTRIVQNSSAPTEAPAPTQAPAPTPAPTPAPEPAPQETEPQVSNQNDLPAGVYWDYVPGVGTVRSDDPRAAGENNFHDQYDSASPEDKAKQDNMQWQ